MIKILIIFFTVSVLYSHSGRTDANGCHTNRKTGQYHCHGSKKSSNTVSYFTGFDSPSDKYDRDNWEHWIDEDTDGQDTRQEVLIEESLIPVTFNDKGKVISGKWFDLYTAQYFTDPSDLDIDHFIPLKNAYDSGGNKWTSKQKQDFANDLDDENHLIAVSKSANRSKGSKSPYKMVAKQ